MLRWVRISVYAAADSGGVQRCAATAELPFSHMERMFAPGQSISIRYAPESRLDLRGKY
jgi:hypothetical protein